MKSVKVLFVPGFSNKSQSANTLCAEYLVNEMNKIDGVEAEIIGDVMDSELYSFNARFRIIDRAKQIYYWPSISEDNIKKCYSALLHSVEGGNVNAIIAAHMPYDSVEAVMRIKKKYPQIKIILYEIDPINYLMDAKSTGLRRYVYFKRKFAERKAYESFDVVVRMIFNKNQYTDKRYRRYDKKTVYLDLPYIVKRKERYDVPLSEKKEKLRLIYTGSLVSHYRSPQYLLALLKSVSSKLPIETQFFARGNCISEIQEAAQDCADIRYCDYVDQETIKDIVENSDCLLSVGNKYSCMLPSKVLSYIESGKPIIHVKTQDNDVCEKYLNRYPLALVISDTEAIESASERTIVFLLETMGKRVDADTICSIYRMNTPEYSAEKLITIIGND